MEKLLVIQSIVAIRLNYNFMNFKEDLFKNNLLRTCDSAISLATCISTPLKTLFYKGFPFATLNSNILYMAGGGEEFSKYSPLPVLP